MGEFSPTETNVMIESRGTKVELSWIVFIVEKYIFGGALFSQNKVISLIYTKNRCTS